MSLMDIIGKVVGGDAVKAISAKLGISPAVAQAAIAAALPLIINALAKNTKKPEGARALDGALERHDGSILDDVLGAITSGSASSDGNNILKHVFGGRRSAVEEGVAQKTGLDASRITELLPMLAPLVMGALGKKKREENLDADGVAGVVGETSAAVKAENPQDPLMSMLDADHDGEVGMGDLQAGLDMLKKLT